MTRFIQSSARARERITDESGVALIAALCALLIILLLSAAAATVSMQTNHYANRDYRNKNALEAAEAGLQVALYRLNMLQPADSNCIADAVATPGSNGWCQSSTTVLGNGSSYQYYSTPVLGSGATCAGYTVSDTSASTDGISNRCITSVGTSNGIVARSQIRAAAFTPREAFPAAITGINGITNNNNAYIGGAEASNQTITASNGVTINGGVELGPSGSFQGSGNPSRTILSSPIVLDPVNTGNSATDNSDARITNGLDNSSGISFDPTTRTLTTTSNHATLTLGGSVYNFCQVTISNNVTINIAPGARVEIFIDSPYDQGSGCPAGTGTLDMANNVRWNFTSQDPTQLQIYVYGTPPNSGGPTNNVTVSNNDTCYCTLYAPWSTVYLSHSSNNSAMVGAVSAQYVNVSNNFDFTWSPNAGNLQVGVQGLYYRTAWTQCASAYSAASPGAGCG
jgi:type II secretory pathway pseudopilin PulG